MIPSYVITGKGCAELIGNIDFNSNSKKICLGHFDLSVDCLRNVGFSDIFLKCGDYYIGLVGEIFNVDFIRELISSYNKGLHLVCELYQMFGDDALRYIDGCFIIMKLYEDGSLTIFPNHSASYPMYYYDKNGVFFITNEIKLFHGNKYVDLSVRQFDNMRMDIEQPSDYTLFKYVRLICPGNSIMCSMKNNCVTVKQDRVAHEPHIELDLSEMECINRLDKLFRKTISDYINLCHNNRVAISLSGGIDSCLVAAYVKSIFPAQEVHTFTFGTEKTNEFDFSKKCADFVGTQHHEILFDEQMFFEGLSKTVYFNEMFHPKFSEVHATMFLVYEEACKYSNLVMGGFNADSLFGGLLNPLIDAAGINKELALKLNRSQWTGEYNPYLARSYGMYECSPYTNVIFSNFASQMPGVLKSRNSELKYILKALAQHHKLLPQNNIWRRKVRLEEGCGTERMLGDFLGIASGTLTRKEEYFIRGKYLYKIFREIFERGRCYLDIDHAEIKKMAL